MSSNWDKPDKTLFMSEEAINQALLDMEKNNQLKTGPVLVKDANHSIRMMSFRDKHASYLKEHPRVNPAHYLANLQAMVKIRP